MKVNEEKTEIAIFYKNNCNPADVLINGINVRTKNTIKVLGIMMDTTLTWHEHVSNQSTRPNQKYTQSKEYNATFKMMRFSSYLKLTVTHLYIMLLMCG